MNLFYKTLEEKKKIISINNYKDEYDHLLNKIVYIIDGPMYSISNNGATDLHTSIKFELPLSLKDNEYFILYKWNEDIDIVEGNIMEKEYLEDYFPEVFIIENRNDVINDIINSDG